MDKRARSLRIEDLQRVRGGQTDLTATTGPTPDEPAASPSGTGKTIAAGWLAR